MAAPEQGAGFSMTPTQRVGFKHISRKSDDLPIGQRPNFKENRSLPGTERGNLSKTFLQAAPPSGLPSSFTVDLRATAQAKSTTPQLESSSPFPTRLQSLAKEEDVVTTSEQRQAAVRGKIAKEMKIKIGTENMLEALLSKNNRPTKEQRFRVEQELGSSNRKLAELRLELDQEIQRSNSPTTPPSKRMTSYFRGSPLRSPAAAQTPLSEFPDPLEEESPTVVLTDTLQALEIEGMQPDFYIEHANTLVDLFKRNPTLKYDLAWSVFSLRVQVMLLSESTDVVAAGYRLTRHAIADRSSLQTIRSLHTDELVILSLVKKGKANLEKEQAVKFIRAFLDVKDGVLELSRAVVRSLVAVAEHQDDRLRSVCALTLAEILAKHPALLISAGGLTTLTDALSEGSFPAPEGLVMSFLHILDSPRQRQLLGNGRQFEAMFAAFTDPQFMNSNEQKLKTSAKAVAAMLKTWPGLLTLSMNAAGPLRSLIQSLAYPISYSRDIILELLFDVLRIKQPSWSSPFLAGRRLTTYGRVSHPQDHQNPARRSRSESEPDGRFDLTTHFSAIVLAMLLRAGLISALTQLIQQEEDPTLKRKATLLLSEILKLAHHLLPEVISANLQVLGDLVSTLSSDNLELMLTNLSMVYQIESINRTINRTLAGQLGRGFDADELAVGPQAMERSRFLASMEGEAFRQALQDSQVLNHTQYTKWKWDLINDLIAGPLTNPKRIDEALKSTKFLKRLTGFYRPFKYRFSGVRNTRPNQRYVRTGCALIRCLMQTTVGVQFLKESKLLRQIAECLAQVDQQSGLTSTNPLFDRHQMEETLSGGYFAMLGALSENVEGIQIMERWHMMNMFYHILERQDREDLIKALLGSMNFSLDTHLRVLLSKALTSARTVIRSFATRLLRKYTVGRVQYSAGLQDPQSSQWALRLVLTQLYDPSVEVCEIAVKILEEACDQRSHLEYVVKCRPALDHLGEIGAPLLLRFLSSSTGYRYLDGLDYITQEMDDWFLGRNDAYVAVVEASLARAYLDQEQQKSIYGEDPIDFHDMGLLPPHFYRELARTEEGCKLLSKSGHFYEFAATIRDFSLDDEDYESLNKIKGCLWAIGNIGSMELGAPFLEESDVVRSVVRIAEGAEVMSVRGTACFALGLISRSRHGFQMLLECGWDTATDSNGLSLGLCIPQDPTRLCLNSFGTKARVDQENPEDLENLKGAVNDLDPLNARILKSIVEFGNPVQYKKTASELHVIKAKHPEAFSRVSLFRKTLFILESHQYRLQARQFILDLFDKSVMRQIVLDDDSAGDETGSNSD